MSAVLHLQKQVLLMFCSCIMDPLGIQTADRDRACKLSKIGAKTLSQK